MITIRELLPEETAQLAQLEAQNHPSPWSEAHFKAACTSPNDTVWLLQVHQQWAAWMVWQHVCGEIELHLITTAAEHRRQGLAGRLLQALEKAACTLNAQRILLEVRANNTAAQQLYRKHGFVQIATRKNYYGGTEDAWIMEKLC